MIKEHKCLNLFQKMLFEKAVIKPPYTLPNIMPNEACFLYIKLGVGYIASEEETVLLEEGESILMKCGYFLGELLSEKKTGEYEAIAIHFYPEILIKIYDGALPSFLKNHNYKFDKNMVKIGAGPLIEKYIEGLMFYFENPQLATEELLILKLKEIILLLLQTKNAPALIEIMKNLFTPRTYNFKEVIEAHIFSNLNTKQLALLTNLSVSTFKRKFKKYYADTPSNYMKSKKLDKATEMLLVSEFSIGEIAFNCGFTDQALFSKCFKESYGISPSQYRLTQINK